MRAIHILASLLVAAPSLELTSANAGPCTDQISQIEHSLQQPTINPSARQAVVAQLHHQPTPDSIETAIREGRAEIGDLLVRARILDAQGDTSECMKVVSRLKITLGH